MCAEITHKVRDMARNLMIAFQEKIGLDWKKVSGKSIMGSVVLTGYNNRTYWIDDVDYDITPMSELQWKGFEKTTYVEYYRKKYNIRIQYPNQPVLVSKSKPREIRGGMSSIEKIKQSRTKLCLKNSNLFTVSTKPLIC
uniref:Piwi-like protein 1 n=1 Tax=Lygus hesperus TaxID=30085 RepID=A0A146L042_LYGHE